MHDDVVQRACNAEPVVLVFEVVPQMDFFHPLSPWGQRDNGAMRNKVDPFIVKQGRNRSCRHRYGEVRALRERLDDNYNNDKHRKAVPNREKQ